MDWITITIETAGIAVLVLWVIVPIQEFRLIFRRLRNQRGEE